MSTARATSSSVRRPIVMPCRCWPNTSVIGVSHGTANWNGTCSGCWAASWKEPVTRCRWNATVESYSPSWVSTSTLVTSASSTYSMVTS